MQKKIQSLVSELRHGRTEDALTELNGLIPQNPASSDLLRLKIEALHVLNRDADALDTALQLPDRRQPIIIQLLAGMQQVTITDELEAVALALNTRPQKTLDWMMPAEVLDKYLK